MSRLQINHRIQTEQAKIVSLTVFDGNASAFELYDTASHSDIYSLSVVPLSSY